MKFLLWLEGILFYFQIRDGKTEVQIYGGPEGLIKHTHNINKNICFQLKDTVMKCCQEDLQFTWWHVIYKLLLFLSDK